MWDYYDNFKRDYEIISYDGISETMTAQEFYEYFILQEMDIKDAFDSVKKRIDSGEVIVTGQYDWDFQLGQSIYKGKLTMRRKDHQLNLQPKSLPPKEPEKCKHENKYINQAGGIRFYVCPKCKADLGNV